jgi:uncharacterized membrane protein
MTFSACFRTLTVATLLGLVGILAPTHAHAWLKICNKSNKTVLVDVTQPDASCQQCNGNVCAGGTSPWRRIGWYSIAADACATVYSGSAANKKFYYEAHSTDWSMVWESANFVWENVYASHNYCASSALFNADKIFNSGHQEISPTATNHTRNLVP